MTTTAEHISLAVPNSPIFGFRKAREAPDKVVVNGSLAFEAPIEWAIHKQLLALPRADPGVG